LASDISNADCFVYGSLIARNTVSANTLFKYLKHVNWKVLDLNLRQPHYRKATIQKLLSTCNLLKINEEELAVIIGLFLPELQDLATSAEKILEISPNIHEMIVTKGADGVSYYSRIENVAVGGKKVKVLDTVVS